MKGTYVQKGETLSYANATGKKIEAGDAVVFGGRLGVAAADIEDGDVGALHVTGVFRLPKGNQAFAMGEALGFDAQDGLKAAGTGAVVGYAAEAAAAGDGDALAKLLG
jgi:predicted RecA/RadA family phage recombinase